uniref:Uncharacterized protein n=1 Tax=Pararge aegeria TaxID=116150 RepID=S4PWP2_9NEOP
MACGEFLPAGLPRILYSHQTFDKLYCVLKIGTCYLPHIRLLVLKGTSCYPRLCPRFCLYSKHPVGTVYLGDV